MRRALTAVLVILALLIVHIASASIQDCAGQQCVYLPLVAKPLPSPTPTNTPTNTPLPTLPPTSTVRPTTGPTATPTLPPPTFNNCQADPNPGAAPNYPVRIVSIDKVGEVVTLRNVSTAAVDLTGWHMCSITGNQEHPIGGVLAPGETRSFPNTGGPIWNNTTSDPGALYNQSGQLVSYHPD
jgi:hypothetical protein